MVHKKRKLVALPWSIVALCVVAAIVIVTVLLLWKPDKDINSFQACKDAGGAIAESYPEQCFIDGKSFTNDAQSIDVDDDGYVGLAEQTALDKAVADNKPVRVVERDGESLPVTADYAPGRLNFYVRNGEVYKVVIEGEDKDL